MSKSWCRFSLSGKSINDLEQMKSEVGNISEKLDTLMAQRQTDDEGQF